MPGNPLAWVAVLAYAAISIALAVRGARGSGSLVSFAVGNRDLPAPVVGLSLAAQLTSVATFVINPGLVHAYGVSALLGYGVFAGLGIMTGLALLSPRFRSQGVRVQALTVAQWLGARYGSPGLRLAFAVLSLGLVSFAVLILVALSLVLSRQLGLPPFPLVIALALLSFGTVLAGGATAHAWTNAVQATIMLGVALVLIGAGLPSLFAGDLFARLGAIDPALVGATNPGSPLFRDAFEAFFCNLVVGLAIVCQPHVLSKALYLRDDRQMRTYLGTAIVAGTVFTGVLLTGLWARLAMPAAARIDGVIPAWIATEFSPAAQVLVAIGMLCAGLSTLEGILLALATILAVDFHPRLRPNAAEGEARRFGRLGLVAVGVVAVGLAGWQITHPTGGTVALFAQYGIYLLFTASFVPLLCGMFVPRADATLAALAAGAAVAGYLLPALLPLTKYGNNPAVLATFGILASVAAAGLRLAVLPRATRA